ncbi:MAG: hypothetical protein HZT43_04255 [Exiguobacterium profundum]|nr:MAG: hypothetical protein HZT43_04255 [Exiguobacterium profundum]
MYVLHAVPDWASFCVHATLAEMGVPFRLNLIDAEGAGWMTRRTAGCSPSG